MKKNLKYAILSAIAFVGAVSFSACSSSDEIVDNPNYNSEKNTVKTEFTISIPNIDKATRMAAADVQASGNFLGIKDFKLFSFASAAASIGSTAGTQINIPDIATDGFTAALKAETDGTHNNAKLYPDIEIAVGTQSFLLYGQSNAARSDADKKFQSGSIVEPASWAVAPNSYTFSLEGIATNDAATNTSGIGHAIVTYLNSIASATGWQEAYAADPTSKLGTLYSNFTSMYTGSSLSIQAAVQDLYHSIFSSTDAVSTEIKTAITNSTYAEAANDGTLTFKSAINGYPASINLPDGAAVISWSDGTPKQASIVTSKTNNGNLSVISGVTPLENFVYPAALYYRTKSNIKTSTVFEQEHYVTSNSWADILGAYANDDATVTAATHSVAIKEPLQYAVGRLALKVVAANASLYDAEGNLVDISTTGLNLTGVIVGGQSDVDFDFLPKGTHDRAIYDRLTTAANVTTSVPDDIMNHTLVFETPSSGDNQKVNIALEFENNTGGDFMGVNGVIPAGTKFYLIAELDPTKTADIKSGTGRDKVFEQDYVTTVTLTIAAGTPGSPNITGLGKAYNVIPDLRSKTLELGLSVNLEWKPGITFEKTI